VNPQPTDPPDPSAVTPPGGHLRPDGRARPLGETVEGSSRIPMKRGVFGWLREYFLGEDPTVGAALVPMCFLSMLLYTRHPFKTNFIFDEQEALLANPYVRAASDPHTKIRWLDAFYRDFWGLTPDRTIGSYRPIPDLVWRALWKLGADQTPFLHHWVNVLLHGVNGTLVTLLFFRFTRRRGAAWLAGALFVASAVVTEAVSGVVGIADVLGGLGALLALLALALPMWGMPIAVFAASLFGFYSKESALCVVPLVAFCALMTSQTMHPQRPLRWARAGLALVASLGAFVLYVQLRRKMFPVTTPPELTVEANAGKDWMHRTYAALLRWYAQPGLPHDPLNNPLIKTGCEGCPSSGYRVAAAFRVYARGLGQVLFPWTLSGDYSSPQEPVPDRLIFPESIIGGLGMIVPLLAAPVLGFWGWLRFRAAAPGVESSPFGPTFRSNDRRIDVRPLIGFAAVWIVVSYFPVSNIPVLLPTVRAERFWYFPVIGSAMLLAIVFMRLYDVMKPRGLSPWLGGFVFLYLGFQSFAARRHANDYTDDLVFWNATRKAVPRSAKAHLNYSVMLGARGNLEGRLESNKVALELAPEWPMASVYYGDTLCRLHRAHEAVPYYERGFELGPNDMNLIALGLQCLWDENQLNQDSEVRGELEDLGDKHPGSWLKYLVDDTLSNGVENKGVNPKYRPRGYNEGPKKDE
jgi:hypothetical protein